MRAIVNVSNAPVCCTRYKRAPAGEVESLITRLWSQNWPYNYLNSFIHIALLITLVFKPLNSENAHLPLASKSNVSGLKQIFFRIKKQ
jgi:hypothetical protein